jgi:hypothetical protein
VAGSAVSLGDAGRAGPTAFALSSTLRVGELVNQQTGLPDNSLAVEVEVDLVGKSRGGASPFEGGLAPGYTRKATFSYGGPAGSNIVSRVGEISRAGGIPSNTFAPVIRVTNLSPFAVRLSVALEGVAEYQDLTVTQSDRYR